MESRVLAKSFQAWKAVALRHFDAELLVILLAVAARQNGRALWPLRLEVLPLLSPEHSLYRIDPLLAETC